MNTVSKNTELNWIRSKWWGHLNMHQLLQEESKLEHM